MKMETKSSVEEMMRRKENGNHRKESEGIRVALVLNA